VIQITIIEQGATPGILKKHWNALVKHCWEAMGNHWHAHLREKHFTHSGATEYGYDKRQGERGNPGDKGFRSSYTGRKLRKFGHSLPLVWSGASRTLSRIRNVRTTKDGARVVMNMPTLNFRKGKLGKGRTMREEMTTVSARERVELAGVWDKAFQERVDGVKEQSARRLWELAIRGR
jgi:hypothetical protein